MVRSATAADGPAIAQIFDETWPRSVGEMADEVRDEPDRFVVLELDGRVIAFLKHADWHNWPDVGGMEAHDPDIDDALLVDWLAVAPDVRGQGIGSSLLREWLANLPSNICYVILNPAPAGAVDDAVSVAALHRFYRDCGFRLLPWRSDEPGFEPYLLGWARPGVWLPDTPDGHASPRI